MRGARCRQLEQTVAALRIRYGDGMLRRASELDQTRSAPHIPTGFGELDALTGCGVPQGALTLLRGRTTSGKHLHWLGIRTLGQYAGLPESAVWQRFGQAGKLAWRWAQGRDDRPVHATQSRLPDPRLVDFDPPEERLDPTLAALMEPLRSVLTDLADRLQGLRHLRLTLHFLSGDCRILDLTFVEPTTLEHPLRTQLAQQLQTLIWPDLLTQAELHILATGELAMEQPFLFPELATPTAQTLSELTQRLRGRYGPIFYQGRVDDPVHPVAERRGGWQPL